MDILFFFPLEQAACFMKCWIMQAGLERGYLLQSCEDIEENTKDTS